MSSQLFNNVMVGVGIGTYAHLPPLERAVDDVEKLTERFRRQGFAIVSKLDGGREETVAELIKGMPGDGMLKEGTVLIVLWAGHANQNPGTDSLRLLAADNQSDEPDAAVFNAEQLAEIAARTGASQILLLIDTCRSGEAVVDMARVVDAVRKTSADKARRWLGVVASCQDYERAVDGALADKLLQLLTHGPTDPALRVRWNSYQAGLRGDDLVDALIKEWGEDERQLPKPISSGDPWPILPNPLFDPGAPEQVVEHLLWAARSTSPTESGIWFVGRRSQLRSIVAWLGAGKPGICVITGSAGSGKSAIAGRIVSLSNSDERRRIVESHGTPPAELDPGEGSIDAHLQVRGMTLERCAEALAEKLAIVGANPAANHFELLAAVAARQTPPKIVIDGLDEAGPEGFRIASELLAPLSRFGQVLVASREIPGSDSVSPSLLSLLSGDDSIEINLDANPDDTDRDVREYVLTRLGAEEEPAPKMDPELVAEEIGTLVRSEKGEEGPFLLSRLITAQLLDQPVDTADDPGWRTKLAQTVEGALERDLALSKPLKRGEEELPQAGRELLNALAYSYGSGFPADDLWPAIAGALSQTGTSYDRLDAFWALGELGRYVTASGQGGQAAYRLHERLARSLRLNRGQAEEGGQAAVDEKVGVALLGAYERFLESGHAAVDHPYLWLYAWRHATDAGEAGIAGMERLGELDATLKPDLAMSLNQLATRHSRAGLHKEAVAQSESAVEILEGLVDEDPALRTELASSLNNLGIFYSEVGRPLEAVAPSERAVKIYEELSKDNPLLLKDLASSLSNLGVRYSEVGKPLDAVAPSERAVEIYEELDEDSLSFQGGFASALNNLGNRYNGIGQGEKAAATTERAARMREDLAKASPAYLSDLAGSLSNLGIFYSETGKPLEAVEPSERAVEIYSELAEENATFLRDLAGSLSNLGVRYREIGRLDAVKPSEQAIAIYEGLATENPAMLGDLGGALTNLGIQYSEIGRLDEGIARTERAVEIYERLSDDNQAFLGPLAMALINLSVRYGEAGQVGDSVEPAERGVRIYEWLAGTNPGHRADLAGALSNLGTAYRLTGRPKSALGIQERSVGLYRELYAEKPVVFGAFANALSSLGNCYLSLDRQADAAKILEEAVSIYEPQAEEIPSHLSDLAGLLGNLSICYHGLERQDEAIAKAERAVELQGAAAAMNPAFNSELANVLGNLSNRYGAADQPEKALAAARQGIQIFEELIAQGATRYRSTLATLLLDLASHQKTTGHDDDAIESAERATAIYEDLAAEEKGQLTGLVTSLNRLTFHFRAAGRDEIDGRWTQAFGRFSDDLSAQIFLRLGRERSREELGAWFDDLAEALDLDAGEVGLVTLKIRRSFRELRKIDQAFFDSRWEQRYGEQPSWFAIDDRVLDSFNDWRVAPTWRDTRDQLETTYASLLSDLTDEARAELEVLTAENSSVGQHLELLRAARETDPKEAFRQLVAQETAARWIEIKKVDASRQFLVEHGDELVLPQAREVLSKRKQVFHLAVLDLVEMESVDFAFDLLADREGQAEALAEARRQPNFERLAAVATICAMATKDPQRSALAFTHMAIAASVLDGGDMGLATIDKVADFEVDRGPLIKAVADAITTHPEHAALFASLIDRLSEDPA